MNILFTLNSGQPGGMEYYVLDLVKELSAKNHEIHVWCAPGVISDWYAQAGATVTEQKVQFDIDFQYIFKLYKYIKEHNISVVHSNELKAAVNSLIAGSFARVPVNISHTHTPISQWQVPYYKKAIFFRFYSLIVRLFATREIALTNHTKSVKVNEGIPESKLEVIPNGINFAPFLISHDEKEAFRAETCKKYNIPAERFIFGALGRLTIEKGQEHLIKAFATLVNTAGIGDSCHLLLAGGGELHKHLSALAEELGISDQVTITGIFENEEKPKLYAAMDVFVFPTLAEGFGLVLIEAMAMGLPAVASNLEVLREVAGPSVAAYFTPGDSTDLAFKMQELYADKENLTQYGIRGQQYVLAHYSVSTFANAYNNLYVKLLQEKNKK